MEMTQKSANEEKKTVLIGLTGREDSAVAAFLLKKQGYNVIGLSIVNIDDSSSAKGVSGVKCRLEDLDRLEKLSKEIGISFYATNAVSRFNEEVIGKLIANRVLGKASSLCFHCHKNRLEILFEKMKLLKADFIATGHFAKVRKSHSLNQYYIGPSANKEHDQSYLLAGLSTKILSKLILPLGEISKVEVRKVAARFGLLGEEGPIEKPITKRSLEISNKISRSACLENHLSAKDDPLKKLIEKSVPSSLRPAGPVVLKGTDKILAEHDGVALYYPNQLSPTFKDSFHLDKSQQIIEVDYKNASILIGTEKDLTFKMLQIVNLQLNFSLSKVKSLDCFMKFSYSNEYFKGVLFFKNNDSALLTLNNPLHPLAVGETLVFYSSNSIGAKLLGMGQVGVRGELTQVDRLADFKRIEEDDNEQVLEDFNYWKF